MFKKLTAPYRHAPAAVRMSRIDGLIAQGAVAELQGSGRERIVLVTFRVNGQIADQFRVQGRAGHAQNFVIGFNRKVREVQR